MLGLVLSIWFLQALIGRLHRQIVGLQTKESQCVGKIHTISGKIGRLEAQLFRMSRKVDEKEDLVIQARSQAYIKCRFENMNPNVYISD